MRAEAVAARRAARYVDGSCRMNGSGFGSYRDILVLSGTRTMVVLLKTGC